MGERGPSALLAFKTQISTTTLIIWPRLELSERFMNNPGLGGLARVALIGYLSSSRDAGRTGADVQGKEE